MTLGLLPRLSFWNKSFGGWLTTLRGKIILCWYFTVLISRAARIVSEGGADKLTGLRVLVSVWEMLRETTANSGPDLLIMWSGG